MRDGRRASLMIMVAGMALAAGAALAQPGGQPPQPDFPPFDQVSTGFDKVEGQDGSDTMLFNGSAANENFDVAANGGRVLFFRNIGNVTMDLDNVETVDVRALGGADTTVVNDLSGTDVTEVKTESSECKVRKGGSELKAKRDAKVDLKLMFKPEKE